MNTIKASLLVIAAPATGSGLGGYIVGAVISLLILLYLIYSLINPEKF